MSEIYLELIIANKRPGTAAKGFISGGYAGNQSLGLKRDR